MKKFYLVIAFSFSFLLATAQAPKEIPCSKYCKVTRVIEEGVLLGVRINNIPGSHTYAQVVEVLPNTSAEKSGYQVGFIIRSVDGVTVNNKEHLVDLIQAHKAGDIVVIEVQNGEKIQKSKIRLGANTTRFEEFTECCDDEEKETVNIAEFGLTIFPNPATNFIQVQTKEALDGDIHIMAYTQEGKVVFYDEFNTKNPLNRKIDIQNFNNGNYIFRLVSAKQTYVQKFEVQK